MRSIYSTLALGSALLLAVAAPLTAQEKKGTNQAPPENAAQAKASAEADSVQQIHLAHSLIKYGRKNKAPEALITAARILAANGTVALEQKPTHEATPGAPKGQKKDKPASDNSPKALLDEAKELSSNNPAVVALANSVELPRGADPEPQQVVEVVQPLDADVYRITFRGGEVARVTVNGDGGSRLDLYVYDEDDKLVASQVGPGDNCLASWVPKWTGVFIIKVVNRGLAPNRYIMATN